jgi:hypothetical protein
MDDDELTATTARGDADARLRLRPGSLAVAISIGVTAAVVVLATSRALSIGDTLARGRQIYGGAFRLSSAQGVWKAGRLGGYAWGSPNSRAVSVHSVVATIDAGDVGCPALSP